MIKRMNQDPCPFSPLYHLTTTQRALRLLALQHTAHISPFPPAGDAFVLNLAHRALLQMSQSRSNPMSQASLKALAQCILACQSDMLLDQHLNL